MFAHFIESESYLIPIQPILPQINTHSRYFDHFATQNWNNTDAG